MKEKQQRASIASSRIGILFLTFGALSFISSVFFANQTLALIGLGLVFWGALFLLVSPMRHVESILLYSTVVSSYFLIDRILKELINLDKKYYLPPFYLPPYSTGSYLPEHLLGLKEMVVFISLDNDNAMPSVDDMAKGNFLSKKPKGLLITPPGLGLLEQIEASSNVDFSEIGIIKACRILPHIISDNLGLAREIEIEFAERQVNLKILDSVYKNLYSDKNNLKSVWLLGCPIVSAVACALAKASGKTVTITEHWLSNKDLVNEVRYSF